MNGAARSILTKAGGASLTSDFIRASFQGPIPPESVPLPLRVANARTDAERAFLKALLRSVRDDAGRAVGAILSGA